MRLRPEAGIAITLLTLIAAWPFWHGATREDVTAMVADEVPPPAPGPQSAVAPDPQGAPQAYVCAGCRDLKRLARRFRAREEGAARRFEAASNRLSVKPPKAPAKAETRQHLRLALRRARDDKRGAAAFRAATLEAMAACESGPGCGQVPLAEYWHGGCPPEHPDLGQEVRELAALNRVIAARAGECAAAPCPEVDCPRHGEILRLLSTLDRTVKGLADAGRIGPGQNAEQPGEAGEFSAELLEQTANWRDRTAALFLGGQDPAAQIRAAAKDTANLSTRLSQARAAASRLKPGPGWRAEVLALHLDRFGRALEALAAAEEADGRDREAKMSVARRQAATAFRDVLVAQMRIRSAQEELSASSAIAVIAKRCDRRRQQEIARALAQIRSARAGLVRCGMRAACVQRRRRAEVDLSVPGLDPVSAQRMRLDQTLSELKRKAQAMVVRAQGPVQIDTVRQRFESGEAVSVRIDLRSTACMADTGAWVGLFDGNAPRLRSREAAAEVIRRMNLRGRPWEEVYFEAPQQPGSYEVRTFAPALRRGGITGLSKFVVERREKGCKGFTGTWETNFGRLQITVREGEVRGSYKRDGAYRAGFLTGNVKDRVLMGQWQSELGGGGTRLVLSEDGKSFKGTWSHFRDEFAGTGVWNGKCNGPVKKPQSGKKRQDNG